MAKDRDLKTELQLLREWAMQRRRHAIMEVNSLSKLLGLPGVKVQRAEQSQTATS